MRLADIQHGTARLPDDVLDIRGTADQDDAAFEAGTAERRRHRDVHRGERHRPTEHGQSDCRSDSDRETHAR